VAAVDDGAGAPPQPDLHGKVVVVTGGNSGVGKETAAQLAAMGARVVIAARNVAKATTASEEILTRSPAATVAVLPLDLASLASIRSFAGAYRDRFDRLDVLVLNAGLVMKTRVETADGFETTFGVNHLGHFLLTQLLVDRLTASAPSRVVVVSSGAHKSARHGLDFEDLMSTRRYRAFRVYAKSKLANIYFTRELATRLAGNGVTVNAVHPGFVASNLGKDGDAGWLGPVAMALGRPFAISPARGARTSVFLASDPSVEDISGEYWYRCGLSPVSEVARDAAAARRLWDVSEQLVGLRD
jgi:NAD(P)-dependent dehydrogenase (short-subunit alcohol dehydrogenase family)